MATHFIIDSHLIKLKGKHIKSLRDGSKLVAQLWEYKKVQYVVYPNDTVMTRDEDNSCGINTALFPYKFNSQSLFRALRK
jgi:hypothetical protein